MNDFDNMPMLDVLCYIQGRVSMEDRYAQLIEECGELIAAVAKMLRIGKGDNPSPLGWDLAKANVDEEIGDVFNCLAVLHCNCPYNDKLRRWAKRLAEKEAGEANG